jgi:hypothetical protein
MQRIPVTNDSAPSYIHRPGLAELPQGDELVDHPLSAPARGGKVPLAFLSVFL